MKATENKVKGFKFFEDKAPKLMKMHLQFFADPPADPGAGDPPPADPPKDPEPFQAPKTQEELDKLLQSNADKRVTEALATAKQKAEQEKENAIKAAKAEAEKLAGLSAAEKQKLQDEQYKADLEAREKALSQRELKIEAINILSEKKLPVSFADLLLSSDAENTKKNIDTFETAFRQAVQDGVTERLKSPTPKGGGKGNVEPGAFGKELAEQQKSNQPDLQKAQQGYFS
ncbi:DUF4355 domain-containing protein [Shouchella lehensis]|uniref:DUF4355 domain-containing protein n=1 Tax=Shouchella lehensis TaxID=300825 RepID=A0A4Y7WIK0_9BACI|nr:DUF4355 domain-containing protein [Shouchella lehensis]TES48074.1 DUF4355 domain-containing protein [Shouchella lehensis]